MDCIFCKIVNGEIPAEKIYEDGKFLAFLDINPNNPGHSLLIPKNHSDNLMATPEDDLADLIGRVPKIARAIGQALDYTAYNFIVNNGREAGQMVDHLHLHIIPRRAGDGLKLFENRKYAEGEMAEVGEKIRAELLRG
jgi:histidine triad (HIT) family protein